VDPNNAEARAGLRFHGFGREGRNERVAMGGWTGSGGQPLEEDMVPGPGDAGKGTSTISDRREIPGLPGQG
jgi:hypothetical protein